MPGLNEYREWAHADAAWLMTQGGSPYAVGDGSADVYLYGFLYPMLGAALQWLTDADALLLLRWLTCALTLDVGRIVATEIFRRSKSRLSALMGFAVVLVAGWQNVVGTAHPAPLGTLFVLLALRAADRRRTVAAALFTVLAFYVKPYFVCVAAPVLVFFVAHDRRRALLYALLLLVVGVASALIIREIFPAYFVYNVVHHFNAASASPLHLLRQLFWLGLTLLPLWALSLVRTARAPRLLREDVWLLATVVFFVVWLRLGLHVGAFLTYAYQLWLPTLAVFALSAAAKLHRAGWRAAFFLSLLMLSLGVGAWRFHLVMPLSEDERKTWADVQTRLDESRNDGEVAIFTPLLARAAADQPGVCALNNGETEYIPTLNTDLPTLRRFFPEIALTEHRAQHFMPTVQSDLRLHKYNTVFTDDFSYISPSTLRAAGYVQVAAFPLRCGVHRLEVTEWKK